MGSSKNSKFSIQRLRLAKPFDRLMANRVNAQFRSI